MTVALLAATALLADAAAFALAVEVVGIAGESNPVAATFYGVAGLEGILVAKAAQAIAAAGLAHRLRHRRIALLPAVAGVAGALTALGALA